MEPNVPESPWSAIGWVLILMGLLLAVIGAVVLLTPSIPWLGRLPGDIRIERENFRFYFPLTTCLILSVVVSLVLWLVRHLGRF